MFGTGRHNPPAGVLPLRLQDRILPRPRSMKLTGQTLALTGGGRPVAALPETGTVSA
jgi:hypothetical protein